MLIETRTSFFLGYPLLLAIRVTRRSTYQLNKKRQATWLVRIKREDIRPDNYPYTRVCSDHFVTGKPSQLYETSHQDWAPSQSLGYSRGQGESSGSERAARASERAARKRKRHESESGEEQAELESCEERAEQQSGETESIGVQTILSCEDIARSENHLKRLEGELCELKTRNKSASQEDIGVRIKKLENEIVELKSKAKQRSLDEDAFKESDEMVRFYTGLSTWELLYLLFTFVKPHLRQRSSLTPFQQLVITLMRLRLNLSVKDLAYRFIVHYSTISHTFLHMINVLHYRLRPLIIWPDRDILYMTMPMDFRKHCPRCVAIIDCFEIFLERPTAREQTYSAYEHHNTIKYLTGITPQGTVSFIS